MKDFLSYIVWVSCATLWATVCFVIPDFVGTPIDGLLGLFQVMTYISACGLGIFFLIYIFGCSRVLCVVTLPIFYIIGAAISFYRFGYHTALTPMLLEVILHTNPEEAMGVISWQVIIWVMANLCIAIGMIWIRWNKLQLSYGLIHFIIVIFLSFGYSNCNTRLHRGLCQRFPYNVPYTIKEYSTSLRALEVKRDIPHYERATTPDTLTIVFIIGESTRADHLYLNGYKRQTTPRLSDRRNIISFSSIYSEQTHTLACLPYILTRADSLHTERQYSEKSFISIFRNLGFYAAWISNQDLGTSFSPFLHECDTTIFANAGKSVYVLAKWMDEELLPPMNMLRTTYTPSKSIFILHTIGSHWYYNHHVPDRMQIFKPTTTNKVVMNNSIDQIVNSYDNTILYMDYFMDTVISSLENDMALVIYQSDHGEALGEDGLFLHGHDIPQEQNPACVIWYSDKYAAANPKKIRALIANKDKRYRTDYLFYSILYAAGIEAEGDNAQVNIFR